MNEKVLIQAIYNKIRDIEARVDNDDTFGTELVTLAMLVHELAHNHKYMVASVCHRLRIREMAPGCGETVKSKFAMATLDWILQEQV
jgi:hypothetical protein